MVPFYILFMELGGVYNSIFALLIFCLASITDLLDGRIARKNKTVTSLGIFLDPLADKLLISAAFICFVGIPMLGITAWMVITIIAREFLMTGLRSIAAAKRVIIPADKAGKFKTTSQIIVIILITLILILNRSFFEFYGITYYAFKYYYSTLAAVMEKTPFWATFAVVLLTIYSGAKYMWKYRKLISEKCE
jgi:CDP-diacylglycerol--glycerol-3-phosphate 3-phosphatidyltransferase